MISRVIKNKGSRTAKKILSSSGFLLKKTLISSSVAGALFLAGEGLVDVLANDTTGPEAIGKLAPGAIVMVATAGTVVVVEYAAGSAIGGPVVAAITIGVTVVYQSATYFYNRGQQLKADELIGYVKCDAARSDVIRWHKDFLEAQEKAGFKKVDDQSPETLRAEEIYQQGRQLENRTEYSAAVEKYQILTRKYPKSRFVPDALVRIGLYYFNKEEYTKAESSFQSFLRSYPDDKHSENVYFKLGLTIRLLADSGDGQDKLTRFFTYSRAGDHFLRFREKYPISELRPAALYWSADNYLKAGRVEDSCLAFKKCVDRFSSSKWAKFARGRLTAEVFDEILSK